MSSFILKFSSLHICTLKRSTPTRLVNVISCGNTTRSVRMRPSPPRPAMGEPGWFSQASIDRDERLLAKYEAQLQQVQRRMKAEENEQAEYFKQKPGQEPMDPAEAHSQYIWDRIYTPHDRKTMEDVGINSFAEMYTCAETAQEMMQAPPNPSIKSLPVQLQVGYRMYKSMPHKMSRGPVAESFRVESDESDDSTT